MNEQTKLTIPELGLKKASDERLVMVAVGEALTAAWAERAGIDIIGVGDSLGMTLHGHENTLAILIGAFDTFKPKFAKRYANMAEIATRAFEDYASDVRNGTFPDAEHSYKMKPEESEKLKQLLAKAETESEGD